MGIFLLSAQEIKRVNKAVNFSDCALGQGTKFLHLLVVQKWYSSFTFLDIKVTFISIYEWRLRKLIRVHFVLERKIRWGNVDCNNFLINILQWQFEDKTSIPISRSILIKFWFRKCKRYHSLSDLLKAYYRWAKPD